MQWAVDGGRRALFAAFGLGKSVMQIEAVRIGAERAGGMGLIVIPLGVRQEFVRDAAMLGVPVKFIRTIEEATDPRGIYLTNYETVRYGKLDPRAFVAVSLDEAAILRGFGGSKTFREFMATIAGDDRKAGIKSAGIPYRFVATATPSPNEYIELLAYAAFLGIMDVGQAKTRFFKRNSEKVDQLTLHPHKERESGSGSAAGRSSSRGRLTSIPASTMRATTSRRWMCAGTKSPPTTALPASRRTARRGCSGRHRSACRRPRARSATVCPRGWPSWWRCAPKIPTRTGYSDTTLSRSARRWKAPSPASPRSTVRRSWNTGKRW